MHPVSSKSAPKTLFILAAIASTTTALPEQYIEAQSLSDWGIWRNFCGSGFRVDSWCRNVPPAMTDQTPLPPGANGGMFGQMPQNPYQQPNNPYQQPNNPYQQPNQYQNNYPQQPQYQDPYNNYYNNPQYSQNPQYPQQGGNWNPQQGGNWNPQQGNTWNPQQGNAWNPQQGNTWNPQQGNTWNPQQGVPPSNPQQGVQQPPPPPPPQRSGPPPKSEPEDDEDIDGPEANEAGIQPRQGLDGGAIAGIVIGSLVGAALLAGLAVFLYRRYRRQKELKEREQDFGSFGRNDLEGVRQMENASFHGWEAEEEQRRANQMGGVFIPARNDTLRVPDPVYSNARSSASIRESLFNNNNSNSGFRDAPSNKSNASSRAKETTTTTTNNINVNPFASPSVGTFQESNGALIQRPAYAYSGRVEPPLPPSSLSRSTSNEAIQAEEITRGVTSGKPSKQGISVVERVRRVLVKRETEEEESNEKPNSIQ